MISVLLPVYNGKKYLLSSITSILNQTYKKFELLIIDDGSEEDIKEVINEINDRRIKYIRKIHSGLGDTLNLGIKLAKYKYITRMDADDIALPNRFEKQIQYLEQNSKVDILSNWYADFEKKVIYITKTSQSHITIKKKLLLYADICHPSVMMKKETIERLGGYKKNIYEKDVFVDYKLWLDIKDQVTFNNLQEVLLLKRYSKKSLSKNNMTKIKKIHYLIQEKYYSDLEKYFGLELEEEQNYYMGLREYFWGDKSKARGYWLKLGKKIINYPKAILFFFLTFLNDNALLEFNEFKIWLRIKKIFMLLNRNERKIIKDLNKFLNNYQTEFK